MSDNDVVIRVEGLGKKYSLHHEQPERYTALRDVWMRQARAAGRWLNPFTLAGQLRQTRRHAGAESGASEEEFWALKDVSFEIRRGERVGIIGRNGAGKSTLLKILSRITEPTTGRVEIRGRVASLLEVGTGFHPELTGRENIYLNGAILGMTQREIRAKFDEIVDFAEVEKFLDTPVKRYSSGMYVRLAFAVAAHLEPEILVVDEVLAVGDASFQEKCLGKMEEVSNSEGRTILFVSHNLPAIRGLCDSTLLLMSGRLKSMLPTNEGIKEYLSSTFPSDIDDNYCVLLDRLKKLCASKGYPVLPVKASLEFSRQKQGLPSVSFTYICHSQYALVSMRFTIYLYNEEGMLVFASTDQNSRNKSDLWQGIGMYKSFCELPDNLLKSGRYFIGISAGIPGQVNFFDMQQSGLSFQVESTSSPVSLLPESWPGIVAPLLSWSISFVEASITP